MSAPFSLWPSIGIGIAVMCVAMLALWWHATKTKNAGTVDMVWSFGTGLFGMWLAWAADGLVTRRVMIAGMAGFWGGRLGVHLWKRLRSDREEDRRYRQLREAMGSRINLVLFGFFQMQAVWTLIFAAPMLAAAMNGESFGWTDIIGILIYVIAMTGEWIADAQLSRFRRDAAAGKVDSPQGEKPVCKRGLWRYSRHPNYFFEWLHWFAYAFLAARGDWFWAAAAGPVVMFVFLTKITGIPHAERSSIASRGDAYRRYQNETNAFFPGPVRSRGDES